MPWDGCAELLARPDYTVVIKKDNAGKEEATWSNGYKTKISRWALGTQTAVSKEVSDNIQQTQKSCILDKTTDPNQIGVWDRSCKNDWQMETTVMKYTDCYKSDGTFMPECISSKYLRANGDMPDNCDRDDGTTIPGCIRNHPPPPAAMAEVSLAETETSSEAETEAQVSELSKLGDDDLA